MGTRRALACMAALVALTAASACRKRVAEPPPRARAKPDASAATAAPAEPPALTPEQKQAVARRLEPSLCRGGTCCVGEVSAAGQDGAGQTLTVVRLDRAPGDRCLLVSSNQPKAKGPNDGQDDGGSTDAGESCHPSDWLLLGERDDKIARKQLLVSHCTRPAGAGFTYKTEVFGLLFRHTQTREPNTPDEDTVDIVLNPLRFLETHRVTGWHGGDWGKVHAWNWKYFMGRHFMKLPRCDQHGQPPEGTDRFGATVLDMDGVALPRVTLPPGFVAGGWKTTALGSCAAFVDGGDNGHRIHGEHLMPGTPETIADSSFRVVASRDGELFVEVEDDRLMGPGKRWINDDHLELWLGEPVPAAELCVKTEDAVPPRQWGIGLTDGRVFPAFGRPASNPTVEVVRAGTRVRVKITLPPADRARSFEDLRVTVVFSDSDDGLRQKRLIGTSALIHGKPWTLGDLHDVRPEEATCVIDAGTLRAEVTPLRLLSDEAVSGLRPICSGWRKRFDW